MFIVSRMMGELLMGADKVFVGITSAKKSYYMRDIFSIFILSFCLYRGSSNEMQ